MKKSLMLGFAGMLFVSASASAISISGQAGEDYTNLGFGMGTESTGLAVSGNWMHNDDDGDVAGLGLGLNIPLGPLMASAGGELFSSVMIASYGRISLVTAASICAGWKGLTTQALAPAAWPSAFLASPASVVSMMTGVNL